MPRGYTTRKLQVFSIHAHQAGVPEDYESLFTALSEVPKQQRAARLGEKIVAIPRLTINEGRVTFTAYEGEEGNPLLYNFEQATERYEPLERGERVATKTHGMISLSTREAVIEYNQKGAKASDISSTFEQIGRSRTARDELSIELLPVADEDFLHMIGRFERIRVATFRVARPNPGWTDHYNHLNEVAEESDARYMEVTMTADRGQSLDENHGIIGYIKTLARATHAYLKGARVTGVRQGEDAETSVALARYIEHQKVQVRMTEDGHVEDRDIERRISNYLVARVRRERQQ
jgi:hypothetical protein